jgi:hypothetical protein
MKQLNPTRNNGKDHNRPEATGMPSSAYALRVCDLRALTLKLLCALLSMSIKQCRQMVSQPRCPHKMEQFSPRQTAAEGDAAMLFVSSSFSM